jgi:cytochrome c
MQNRAILVAGMITVMVTACGSSQSQEVVEQIVVREPGQPVNEPAANTTQAENAALRERGGQQGGVALVDLVAQGKDAFQMCNGCHVVEAGAPSGAGPNLNGVVGRQVGSVEFYPYSDALASADFVWDNATLDRYLANPVGYLPGTDMVAGAVRDGTSRAAIIAYLADQSE